VQSFRLILPVVLAAVLTAANALKPPVIDDTAYLALARQIAGHPLDPYGFEQFWYQEPEPANHILAPPVLPCWLGLGIRLLGEQPLLLKLWLFPIALLFVYSLHVLLRRFARPMESPMLVLAVLSPAVLPAFDFMLDLPSLAFSLAALAVFLWGLDKRSLTFAVGAGILAALAMQTKYIGFLAPPLLLVAGMLRRRYLPGVVAALVAAALFGAWELFVGLKYGESHFLYQLAHEGTGWNEKLANAPWLITLLGGLAPGIALAALAGWRWCLIASSASLLVVHLCLGLFAPDYTPLYLVVGWTTVVMLAAAFTARLISYARRRRVSRGTMLVVVWVAAEVAGYFALTPFPASRRIIGLTLALTVLTGRILATTSRHRQASVWLAIIPGIALGLNFAAVDIADSQIEPDAVKEAAREIRAVDPNPTIWFVGHWGFQYAAEKEGMKAVAPGRSILRKGDWLLVPDGGPPSFQNQQSLQPDLREGPVLYTVVIRHCFPRATRPWYYGGQWPLVYMDEVRLEVRIYRIQDMWVPR
jgi:hypothetical protein